MVPFRGTLPLVRLGLFVNASFVARATAYALSAGAHVAIALVTFGHSAPTQGTADTATEITIETPVDIVADEPKPEPEPEPANNAKAAGSPTPATHTHPYPVPFDHDAHPHDPNLVHAPLAHDDDHDHDHDHAEPVVAAPAPAAHFTMHMTTSGATNGSPTGVGEAHGPSGDAVSTTPMAEAAVSVPARLVGSVTPAYPPTARQNEIEADVALEIIVANDGRVLDARVTKPAGYGFDDAAIRAVRAARFTPALHDGHAVPVRMRWSVAFRLR